MRIQVCKNLGEKTKENITKGGEKFSMYNWSGAPHVICPMMSAHGESRANIVFFLFPRRGIRSIEAEA